MKTISLTAAFTLLFFTASFAGNVKKQQDPKAKKQTTATASTAKPAAKPVATAKPAATNTSSTAAPASTATAAKPAAKPSPAAMHPAHKTREKTVAPVGTKKPTSGTRNFSRAYKGKHHLFHHHHAAQTSK